MTEAEMFDRQMELNFVAQKNKRRGREAVDYEQHIVSNTVRGTRRRLDKTLRIERNAAFLTPTPSWREIMTTEFEGRKIDHEICDFIIPLADKILSPYTFNNRKGMGPQAAINCLIEHICEVTEGYTKPARIIKLDFKGYFPHALWDYAEKCLCSIIDTSNADEGTKSYLKWLTMISVHCNPAAHCELRTPKYLWTEHINPDKSILTKREGEGAAIGRLVWQTAMGLYINDIILWLTEECGIRLVCFVDDIVMIVPEHLHEYALSLIQVLRIKLKDRNVFLNERKFYDQPYEHGLEFLGSHIKKHRIHLNNITFERAMARVDKMNEERYKDIDCMVATFNSCTGLMKNRTDHKRIIKLKDELSPDWWKFLVWNKKKKCLGYNDGFSPSERLNRKYELNLKKYRRNETKRNHRCNQRAVHKKA